MGRRAAMLSRLAAPVAAVAVCLCLALLALAWLAPNAEGRSFGQSVSLIARTALARALLPGRNYRIWVNSLLGPMREGGGQAQSEQLLPPARLPLIPLAGMPTKLHVGFIVALLAAAAVAIVLRRTTFGFRLRAVGANPVAARFAGMSVGRVS